MKDHREWLEISDLDRGWSVDFKDKPFWAWLIKHEDVLFGSAVPDITTYLEVEYGFNCNLKVPPRDLQCLKLTYDYFWEVLNPRNVT